MQSISNGRVYDLEERTYRFAKEVSSLCIRLPKNVIVLEHIKQVVRSSGSVGANYIEANEALSKKDFLMRIKIARKEAKESEFWLKLLREEISMGFSKDIDLLINESIELKKILSSILLK